MSLEVLLSYSVIATIALVVGVLGASYAGTTLALRRFFDDDRRGIE